MGRAQRALGEPYSILGKRTIFNHMKLYIKNLILSLPILIIILAIYFSLAKVSYAVPAAQSPVCAIDATVLTVQKVKTNIAGLGNPPREDFYYYAVKLKIQSSLVYQQEGSGSCDNLINLDQDSKLHLTEYDKVPIKVGQKINAKLRFGGDEWFNGYFLSEVKVISTTSTTNLIPQGFINIILLLIFVALVGAGVYFVSTRQVPPPT